MNWKLLLLRLAKFATLALSVGMTVILAFKIVDSWRDFMIFVYYCIFDLMLLLSLMPNLVAKLAFITRYFQLLF